MTISPEELRARVTRGEIDTVLVVFPDLYGRLMGKRVTGRHFVETVLADGMHACDYLLASDMEMDVVSGYAFATWERGDGDMHAVPDMSTLRVAAWLPSTAMVLCDLYRDGHHPIDFAPTKDLIPHGSSGINLGTQDLAG